MRKNKAKSIGLLFLICFKAMSGFLPKGIDKIVAMCYIVDSTLNRPKTRKEASTSGEPR